ncbi:MAG TPA: nuclease-related domain-containing protein [Acidimicrobiales bacterium]|nr:nuclease-related domain-containing protein [Acidimicrobiales bacterium]
MAAVLVAATDLATAAAAPGNALGALGLPAVPDDARSPMLAYGAFLGVVGLIAIATSYRRPRATARPRPVRRSDEASVMHRLRSKGWFVVDGVELAHADIDHIAVGPAGVLAVQRMHTDKPDPRGKPAVRARIAAQQLRHELALRELAVEVVPALLAFGPGQVDAPGGVMVVDSVAVLFADAAPQWMAELSGRELLPETMLSRVRAAVHELVEERAGAAAVAPAGAARMALSA